MLLNKTLFVSSLVLFFTNYIDNENKYIPNECEWRQKLDFGLFFSIVFTAGNFDLLYIQINIFPKKTCWKSDRKCYIM
jgi:hypothetical protein